jgi:hypothetical protein
LVCWCELQILNYAYLVPVAVLFIGCGEGTIKISTISLFEISFFLKKIVHSFNTLELCIKATINENIFNGQ